MWSFGISMMPQPACTHSPPPATSLLLTSTYTRIYVDKYPSSCPLLSLSVSLSASSCVLGSLFADRESLWSVGLDRRASPFCLLSLPLFHLFSFSLSLSSASCQIFSVIPDERLWSNDYFPVGVELPPEEVARLTGKVYDEDEEEPRPLPRREDPAKDRPAEETSPMQAEHAKVDRLVNGDQERETERENSSSLVLSRHPLPTALLTVNNASTSLVSYSLYTRKKKKNKHGHMASLSSTADRKAEEKHLDARQIDEETLCKYQFTRDYICQLVSSTSPSPRHQDKNSYKLPESAAKRVCMHVCMHVCQSMWVCT